MAIFQHIILHPIKNVSSATFPQGVFLDYLQDSSKLLTHSTTINVDTFQFD